MEPSLDKIRTSGKFHVMEEPINPKLRVLLTDGLFPNRFSTWRNVEILSFMQEFETTVLVKHGKNWAGINFEIEPEIPEYENRLTTYKFLIFDPAYNYLNKYNQGFDGTRFNGLIATYSYALTKDTTFDILNFNHYYHIFLGNFIEFNSVFQIPAAKQTIHLYPGGGYTHEMKLNLPDAVGVVSTFPTTSLKLMRLGIAHVDCWSVPLYLKDESYSKRVIHEGPLRICFASLGYGSEKGDKTYRWIARIMTVLFRKIEFEFVSIGNCAKSRFIKNIPPMSWKQLEEFYADRVDLYINPVAKRSTNGWPIGQEAMKQGCVVITYDVNAIANHFNAEFYGIQVVKNTFGIVRKILKLHKNRHFLEKTSISNQEFVRRYAGFESQQGTIFSFIKERVEGNANE